MPIVLPSSTPTSPNGLAASTLAQIRQYAAVELGGEGVGGFLESLATGGTTNTLIDNTWPANTTLDVAEQWQDAWLLRPDATLSTDRVRLVDTYTPNGGIFQADLMWTNVPVSGEPYEIHTVLEPATALLKCINFGLKRCMIEVEFSFVPIGGATWHNMSQVAPWLASKTWVRQVGYLSNTEDRNRVWPYERVVRGEAYEENGTVVLSHPGQTFGASGQTNPYVVYVRAMAPAWSFCLAASHNYGTASAVVTNGTSWTITVPSTTGMSRGQEVTLASFVPTGYNGTFVIIDIPSSTTLTVAIATQPGTVTSFGSVTSTSTQDGLSLETDIAPVPVEWPAWAAIIEAWRHYGQALDTVARQRLIPNRAEAASMFTSFCPGISLWPKQTFRPLLAGGPIWYGGSSAYRASTA